MHNTARSQDFMSERAITGRHVLYGLIAFFGLIFAVNGVFLYQALSTHTGVVANEPYRKGLAYNDRIAADLVQTGSGWTDGIALSEGADRLEFKLTDRDSRPVTGLAVTARIGRPSTVAHDRQYDLRETAPGRYAASFDRLDTGTWQADIEARQLKSSGEETVWRSRKRLWLKP